MHMKHLLGATLVALLGISSAAAQTPPRSGEVLQVHPEAREAISKIKSPYCPGLMLEVCTSSGGAMLRDSIQEMAEDGMASEEIVEAILARHGEEWRAEPRPEGTGLWAWLLPPVGLVVGAGAVGVVLARRRRTTEALDPISLTEDDEQRLEEAMREMESLEQPDW